MTSDIVLPSEGGKQLWHLKERKYKLFLALSCSRGLFREGSCNKQKKLLKLTMPLSCEPSNELILI